MAVLGWFRRRLHVSSALSWLLWWLWHVWWVPSSHHIHDRSCSTLTYWTVIHQKWPQRFAPSRVIGSFIHRVTEHGPITPNVETCPMITRGWDLRHVCFIFHISFICWSLTRRHFSWYFSHVFYVIFWFCVFQTAFNLFYLALIGHGLSLISLFISLGIFFYFK